MCKHCSAVSRRGFHWPMVLFPKSIRISHHFVQFWVYHYSMSMTRYWKNVLLWKCEETMRISPRWWWWERGSGLAAAQPAACSAVLLLLASLSKPPELEPRPSSSASEGGSCVIELGGSSEERGKCSWVSRKAGEGGEGFLVLWKPGIDTQGPRCAATKPNLHVRLPGQKSNEPGLCAFWCDLWRDMTSVGLSSAGLFTTTHDLLQSLASHPIPSLSSEPEIFLHF